MGLVVERESSFGEWYEWKFISLDRVLPDAAQEIRRLWELWQETRMAPGGTSPLGEFSWVDVSPENPGEFVWLRHPGGVCGNWANRCLNEHASRLHREAIARDYLMCKTLNRPVYVDIHQHIMGVTRKYRRLAVPVTDRGRVTRIAYAHSPLGASVPYPGSCEVIQLDSARPAASRGAPFRPPDTGRTSMP